MYERELGAECGLEAGCAGVLVVMGVAWIVVSRGERPGFLKTETALCFDAM